MGWCSHVQNNIKEWFLSLVFLCSSLCQSIVNFLKSRCIKIRARLTAAGIEGFLSNRPGECHKSATRKYYLRFSHSGGKKHNWVIPSMQYCSSILCPCYRCHNIIMYKILNSQFCTMKIIVVFFFIIINSTSQLNQLTILFLLRFCHVLLTWKTAIFLQLKFFHI